MTSTKSMRPEGCIRFLQKLFIFVLVVVTIILALVSFHSFYPFTDPVSRLRALDKLSLLLGVHELSAVVVIDLDLWTTSVFTYIFQRQISDGSFVISSEWKHHIIPGIFEAPTNLELEARISNIINKAKHNLPEKVVSKGVPVLAKLSPEAVDHFAQPELQRIIQHLDQVLLRSPFQYHRDFSLGTLSHSEQTVLQWFAINLLGHRLKDWSVSQSSVIFDVKDSDLHLTLAVGSQTDLSGANIVHTKKLSAFGHLIKLVTVSIPGLGLFAGRRAILKASNQNLSPSDPVSTFCLNPIANATWMWNNETLLVKGLGDAGDHELVKESNGPFAGKKVNRPVANYDKCHSVALKYVRDVLNGSEAAGRIKDLLHGRPVFMEGLLQDKCFERGLSFPYEGGHVKMKEFITSLRHACKVPNTDQPFMCADLMYLGVLVDQLLGFKLGNVIHSSLSVGNRGLTGNWQMAVAFYVYQNGL